jgi:hypothetical protein
MEFEQFQENFNARYQYEVWKNDIDWNSFVIAGGSVTLSLLKQTSLEKGSDVDLFFLKNDSKLFKEAVVRSFSFRLCSSPVSYHHNLLFIFDGYNFFYSQKYFNINTRTKSN